jgi:alpha-glucosidase
MLNLYRSALARRRELHGVLDHEPLTWRPSPPDVLDFSRGPTFRCVVNLSEDIVTLDGPALLSSAGDATSGVLPPDSTAWLLLPDDAQGS